jgi:hypothetical protein
VSLRVSYSLLVTTTVTITLQREVPGRRMNGHCVKPTSRNRRRPTCTRLVGVTGSLTLSGSPGANRFAFNGKIGGRDLGPGSYLLTATPSGGTGSTAFFELV